MNVHSCMEEKLRSFSSFTQSSPATFNHYAAIRFCLWIWAFWIVTLFILCQFGTSV